MNPGSSKEGIQPPSVEAVTPKNDGFYTCRKGGDTLDAFAPLTHRGQKPQTADQPAQWMKIASSFT